VPLDYDDNPKGWAQRAFDRWLIATPEHQVERLGQWLQNGEEASGWGDEPFHWVLSLLPPGAARADAERALAAAIAGLLTRRPDVEPFGRHPEQLLHNLLALATAIHHPPLLAGPLKEVYTRRRLSGRFAGLDLRERLRAALIANQSDDSLAPLWERMADGPDGDSLPGNALHAFYGTLMLPPDNGKPSGLLGRAFAAAARHLDWDVNLRRPRFLDLIASARQAFDQGVSDLDLLYMADRNGWLPWTRTCLEIPFRAGELVFVPRCLGTGLHYRFAVVPERVLWDGFVYSMRLDKTALEHLEVFRKRFIDYLRRSPDKSDAAWVGLFGRALGEYTTSLGDREAIRAITIEYFQQQHPLNPRYPIDLSASVRPLAR